MFVMQIENIKDFVNQLLSHEAWGRFRLYEAEVKGFCTLRIDGSLNREFFDQEEEMEDQKYAAWKDIKGIFYQAIRGNKLPVSFKINLVADEETVEELLEKEHLSIQNSEVVSLNLNIYYERGSLAATTGTSLKIFTMDKTLEYAWENYIKDFFKTMNIS